MVKRLIAGCAAIAALAASPAANAKDFRPGDLRLCDARRCVAVVDHSALDALSDLYYSAKPPTIAGAPRLAAPMLRLKFRNGYVTGIVASAALDRFLSYGVNLGRLQQGTWYRVPAVAAAELRALAGQLRPLRLTHAAIARSR
jgi:hypothetical protein